MGRGRSSSVRLGRARRRGRRPVLFLRYIAAAIHGVEPLPLEVFDALSGPGGSTWSTRVPRVGSALAALERPLVLVLDDLHAVAQPVCLDVLAALVGFFPAGSQIAVASREEPALPLARWRARGLVGEVGAPTSGSTSRRPSRCSPRRRGLEPNELTELTERTEGWPAGCTSRRCRCRRGVEHGERRAASAATTASSPSTSASSCSSRLPAAEARFLQYTLGARADVRRALRRGDAGDGVGAHTRGLARASNGFVVPLDRRVSGIAITGCSASCCGTSSGAREPALVSALNRPRDGVVHRQRLEPEAAVDVRARRG